MRIPCDRAEKMLLNGHEEEGHQHREGHRWHPPRPPCYFHDATGCLYSPLRKVFDGNEPAKGFAALSAE